MVIMQTYEINGLKFKPFIDRAKIAGVVEYLGKKISQDYADKEPLCLVILKGSIIFAADLIRSIDLPVEIEAIRAKSYGSSMQSSGRVNITVSDLNLKGRDVIIIEDIVDTGNTLSALMETIEKMEPASVEIVTFLSKPSMRKTDVRVKYIGVEIPPEFVVGYGLDYAEKGRQLPDIYVLDDSDAE